MRLVFMGTPEFAAVSLSALAEKFEVVAAVSQPDRPRGRGYILEPTPVKTAAERLSIPVYQPESVRTPEGIALIKSFEPEVICVVAYGRILPKEVLDIPRLGCVNLHASLLPKYRGAAPIEWAVANGEEITGVTAMYMAEGMDTGDMIGSAEVAILPDETGGELRTRLAGIGAQLLCGALAEVFAGTAARTPQDDEMASFAPLLKKEMGLIDFSLPAKQVYNRIRGFTPMPGAFCFVGGKRLKVARAALVPELQGDAGQAVLSGGRLMICCGEGAVELREVVFEGRGAMTGAAFYNGKKFLRVD